MADTTDASEKSEGPRIAEAGFSMDSKALFYKLRFTDGAVGAKSSKAVTPEEYAGSVQGDSLYAGILGLKQEDTYYLMIEELTGDDVTAKCVFELESGKLSVTVWMSIKDSKIYTSYSDRTAIAMTEEGSFSTDVSGQSFRITLKSNGGFSAAGPLSQKIVDNLETNTNILAIECASNTVDGDNVEALGRSFGYAGTKSQYAGALISVPLGDYIVGFLMTNDISSSVDIVYGDKKFTVPADCVRENTGYGYFIIDSEVLADEGMDCFGQTFSVTVYNGNTVHASSVHEKPSSDGGSDYALVIVIIGVDVFVIVSLMLAVLRRN